MNLLPIASIIISENRQRREFNESRLQELKESIESKGLLHAIVCRKSAEDEWTLVAGERRLRAIADIASLDGHFLHDGGIVPAGFIPFVDIGSLPAIECEEAELEENLRRENLTWQEESAALARLAVLRTTLAQASGGTAPTLQGLADEIPGPLGGTSPAEIREKLLVSEHLDDPDIAGAKTAKEAFKILKRKDRASRNAELGVEIGKTFSSADHTILNEDSLFWLAKCPAESFDVILTDPPYGMGADEFGNSGGAGGAVGAHGYADDAANLQTIAGVIEDHAFRIAKPQAHLYLFCDIDWFPYWKTLLTRGKWTVFRTPIIWHKPSGMRAPWPEGGPQRRYELCLFASKGKRPVNMLAGDVIACNPDDNLGHSAQKPVALFEELLRRSVRPGDSVLDPFAGTGPIIPAAHSLQCRATVIEKDLSSYGICLGRAKALTTQASLLEGL